MDPRTDLHLVELRRSELERRATEHRLARSLRPRRSLPVRFRQAPRPAGAAAPLACCPA